MGYRFDMGPTILLMPSVLRRIFAEAGRDLQDELELIPLDPQWRSFFADGSILDLHADPARMARALDEFAPGGTASEGYRKFLDLSERLDDISQRYFFWRSIGSFRDMFDPTTAVSLSTLGDVLADAAVEHRRGDDPKPRGRPPRLPDARPLHPVRRARLPTFRRPCSAASPTCRRPKGSGIRAAAPARVAEALARLADELGVELHCGSGVQTILTGRDGSISGVALDDGTQRAPGGS